MTTHTFTPTRYYNNLCSAEPALIMRDGDSVITTCVDAWGIDAHDAQVTPRGNPMTGPFFVQGAEPGDTLAVHLIRITPNRRHGWSGAALAPNVVDPDFVPSLPVDAEGRRPLATWDVDVAAGTATLLAPVTSLGRCTLPIAPMLGCFGVAPAEGQAISTATSAEHGGNMDYRGFVAGVTVYFPVFAPGALFFLGDAHALQGDGEMVGTGIEISCDVEFSVRVQKERRIGWPRGENATHIFTLGNARPLDQAVQNATTEMARWLQSEYALDSMGAQTLMGQTVAYELGNMFDPAYTFVCKMETQLLAGLPRP